jgi:predicted Zn-dependent protease
MPNPRFFFVLALLLAGAALSMFGTQDRSVGLSSVVRVWSDMLRDVDQVGLQFTRISDPEEMRIGDEMAGGMGDVHPPDSPQSKYVETVGQAIARHAARTGIRYQFRVTHSADINAFALPGGHVYVTSGLLYFVQSEAELAAVLGHEISHVDLRHCIERFQYEQTLRNAGLPEAGWIIEAAHRLAAASFSQDQELDADAAGVRMSVETGYDPGAAADLFTRMAARFHEGAPQAAGTPGEEAAQAVNQALTAYFRSHPPSAERSRRLAELIAQNRERLRGNRYYVGRENLSLLLSRFERELPGEWKQF